MPLAHFSANRVLTTRLGGAPGVCEPRAESTFGNPLLGRRSLRPVESILLRQAFDRLVHLLLGRALDPVEPPDPLRRGFSYSRHVPKSQVGWGRNPGDGD
jgi:hypothetical protein